MKTKSIQHPSQGFTAKFIDRHEMRRGHTWRRFKLAPAMSALRQISFDLSKPEFSTVLPTPTLPIDWTKGNTMVFPEDGNVETASQTGYGDCLYAAPLHQDNTWTGNVGTESSFDRATIVADYLKLSGGDNGLDESMIIPAWQAGLASNPAANIFGHMDVDPTDTVMMQTCIWLFGGVILTLSVPDKWFNSWATGVTWTSPANPDPSNGHAILLNGVNAAGDYEDQTWGSWNWITPSGVGEVDPGAIVAFSMRWFNAQGYAPNGYHYTQLAVIAVAAGSDPWPTSPFPPPGAPTPAPPVPTPTPAPAPVPTPPAPTPTPEPEPAPGRVTAGEIAAIPAVEVLHSKISPAHQMAFTAACIAIAGYINHLLAGRSAPDPVPTSAPAVVPVPASAPKPPVKHNTRETLVTDYPITKDVVDVLRDVHSVPAGEINGILDRFAEILNQATGAQ